jgi:hypothetical protein
MSGFTNQIVLFSALALLSVIAALKSAKLFRTIPEPQRTRLLVSCAAAYPIILALVLHFVFRIGPIFYMLVTYAALTTDHIQPATRVASLLLSVEGGILFFLPGILWLREFLTHGRSATLQVAASAAYVICISTAIVIVELFGACLVDGPCEGP